ncbi:MAG: ABC transporter permease [Bacteroidota bacterium]
MKSNHQKYTNTPDGLGLFLQKIWRSRALVLLLAKRDLKVKYAQTILGVGWSIIQPLTGMLVFSLFFGYVLNWQVKDLPFPLYVLSGLLSWNFFSYVVNAGAGSLQESSAIIKKIHFPKSILPLSKVLVALVELGISFFILLLLIVYYQYAISWKIVFVPLALLFNTVCGLALVFWVAAFAYRKRDLFHLLPFVVYFGIWFTPVFFGTDLLPQNLRPLLLLNPMASVVELWRWMIFGTSAFNYYWIVSFVITLLFCLTGMYFYSRKEKDFSDYL